MRFRPTATGVLTGTLTITDSDPTSPQIVTLTGTGVQPVANLTPSLPNLRSHSPPYDECAFWVHPVERGNGAAHNQQHLHWGHKSGPVCHLQQHLWREPGGWRELHNQRDVLVRMRARSTLASGSPTTLLVVHRRRR